MNAELARWLDEATRGLPAAAAAQVRTELSDHYADALDDYAARGKAPSEAHRAALDDLGCAASVRAGLREIYLAPRRYRLAMAAALIFPLAIILDCAGLLTGAGGDVLYYLASLLPTLYILRTFQTLLALRFRIQTPRIMFAAALGLCAMSLPRRIGAVYRLYREHRRRLSVAGSRQRAGGAGRCGHSRHAGDGRGLRRAVRCAVLC